MSDATNAVATNFDGLVSGNRAQFDQFGRAWQLVLVAGERGLDLSQLHLRFETTQMDTQTPNTCFVRIYNLAQSTVDRIYALSAPSIAGNAGSEYARVIVQAGYVKGNFGVIFDGTLKQIRSGRETNVDSFVDLLAADIDLPYNFGTIRKTLGPGVTPQQQAESIREAFNQYANPQIGAGDLGAMGAGGTLPRGKVLWGMARDEWRLLGNTTGTKMFVQDGKLIAMPFTGYLPGEAVVINSFTGMVGTPELTQNGLELTCLLNPKIRIGTRIKVNNAEVNKSVVVNRGTQPPLNDLTLFAAENADGIYRVAVHEMEGDTRGTPWYSRLTGLSVDPSASPDKSVYKYG